MLDNIITCKKVYWLCVFFVFFVFFVFLANIMLLLREWLGSEWLVVFHCGGNHVKYSA